MLPDYNINPPDSAEPRVVCKCKYCKADLLEGDEVHKIGDDYYCDDCVEHTTLECEPYEPDWDSMPGGYDY